MQPPPFAWASVSVHPEVVAGAALLGGLYAGAWISRPGRVGLRDGVWFGAGLAALLLALNGPLHDLSDFHLFSAHMVQHLVLTLVVPPCLLAGTPPWMLDGVLGPLWRRGAPRAAVGALTRPLPAFVVWSVALVAWHLPGPHSLALERHPWHVVQHLTLLGAGTLGWWPILSRSTLAPALGYAAQLLYLFVFGMPMTAVAAFVTAADRVLYPFYAAAPRLFGLSVLDDQRLGGVIMWVPAGLIPLLAFTVVYFRWAAAEAEV
jgi:putative membrane protein